MNAHLARLALSFLGSENGRKALAWVLALVLAPLLLLVSVIACLASGEAQHNKGTVEVCFYGAELSEKTPAEYREHIREMRQAFSLLDSAVASVNSRAESGGLDPIMVKAVFLALCFGEDAPSRRAAGRFVNCFYTETERIRLVEQEDEDGNRITVEERYTVISPLSLSTACGNLSSLLGREITESDRKNIQHIYTMVAGSMGDVNYDGQYSVSGGHSEDMAGLVLTDGSKTAADLVRYARNAYESGWGYVWGTFGNVLTEEAFAAKLNQYPEGVGNYADFIRANWLGRRTVDCAGLIKSYCWYDEETQTITYAANGMLDLSANQFYYTAAESGPIGTIPEIPGLAVWHDGHIGVYIGGGEVIEAMGTRYGVVKTQLAGRGWTHWLKIPGINYD